MVDFVKAIRTPLENTQLLIAPAILYFIIFIISAISGGFLVIANLVTIFSPQIGLALAGFAVIVAIALSVLILFLTLIVDGYLLSLFQNILDKRKLLTFQMSEVFGYILRAIKAAIISFIYMLPGTVFLIIALVIVFGGAIIGAITGGNTQQLMQTFMAGLLTAGLIAVPFILLAVVFFVIAGYLLPAALSIWLKEDNLIAAFSFGRVIKNAIKLDYFLSLVVAFAVSLILGMVVGLLSFLIVLIISLIFPSVASSISTFFSNLVGFIVAIILYAMLAQVIE